MDKELKRAALEACLAVGRLGLAAARRPDDDVVAAEINRVAMQFADGMAVASHGELPMLQVRTGA